MKDSKKPMYIFTELGKEKLCKYCEDYYPLDDEFFYHRMKKTKKQECISNTRLYARLVTQFITTSKLTVEIELGLSMRRWRHECI